MKQQLEVIAGPDAPRRLEMVDGQAVLIGRGKASDLQIHDAKISRVHCRVILDSGKVTLVDSDSMGGTYVGKEKITQRQLNPGDVFRLGDTAIRYQVHAEQEAGRPADTVSAVSKPRFQLRVSNGKQRGRRFAVSDLKAEQYGRSPECDHQINDPFVSRNHFLIQPVDEQTAWQGRANPSAQLDQRSHLIEDLGTQHGTRINGAPIKTMTLCTGDRIQVGTTVLIYEPLQRSIFRPSIEHAVLLATVGMQHGHCVHWMRWFSSSTVTPPLLLDPPVFHPRLS